MLLTSLLQSVSLFVLTPVLTLLLILFYLIGAGLRKRGIKKAEDTEPQTDVAAISSTLLGLLALLLAFSFGMANGRYDTRRNIVVDETNAIGTAILRTDVYPDSIRTPLRIEFKKYVESRIAFYHKGVDGGQIYEYYNQSKVISDRIWKIASTYARAATETEEAAQLLPAITLMIDIASSRLSSNLAKVPDSIIYFLFIMSLCSAFLMGYERKTKIEWISVTGFSLMLSLTVFTILDLDRPRSGLIDLDEPNQRMVELLQDFE
ncbi:MAG TPA: hypothetical protein VGK59_18385 [Ohtaekwangia sp.]